MQAVATAVATVFVLVGIAGFVPGLTTNAGDLEFFGPHGDAAGQPELLGVFHVSVLHNLVHLVFGLAGLMLARRVRTAVAFLVGGGLTYGLVFLYGMMVDQDSHANFLPVNTADNWLHAALAVAMVAAGLALGGRATVADAGAPAAGRHDAR